MMIKSERVFLLFLLHRLIAIEFEFDLQPQPIRLNNLDDIYLTNDEHFLGQVLYRFDRIHLACECRSSTSHRIFWTINDRIINDDFNSSNLQIEINRGTVQSPTTDVTCHCLFNLNNRSEMKKSFRYQFYIDFESEPTLKPIDYILQINWIQRRFHRFLHHPHFKIFSPLFILIFLLTCSLIIANCMLSYHWI